MITVALALLLGQANAPGLPPFPQPWAEYSSDMSHETFDTIRAGSYRYCLHRAGVTGLDRCMLLQDSNMASIARSLRTLRAWRPAADYSGTIERCWTIYSDNPEPDARVYESCLEGHAEAAVIRGMIRAAIKN